MSWSRINELLTETLFTIGGTDVTAVALLTAAIILLLALWLSRFFERASARMLRFSRIEDESSLVVIGRIIHYVVLVVGVAIALQTIGINLTSLFAAGAVLAVAVGFAAQNVLQNFFSGLILLSERAIKPGDVIELDGRVVKVTQMRIRSTVVRTRDEEDVIVPNTMLAQSAVKNYTMRDRLYRLRTVVGVAYGSDMEMVKQVLRDAAASLPFRREDRDPVVLMSEFGSSSVNFDVSVWVEDPWTTLATRSGLNEAIWFALKDAGISIAFPQMDVHLDAAVMERLGKAPRS